jgi:TRAP-type C4-dicarboxylate transport system substrate-binding protein
MTPRRRSWALSLLAVLVTTCAASAEDFAWRFFSVSPATHPYAQEITKGLAAIDKRSNGQLKIQFVTFGETPYKPGDSLSLIKDGLVETVEWTPTYTAGTYPLLVAAELPFVNPAFTDAAGAQKATNAAWARPALQAAVTGLLDEYGSMHMAKWYYEPLNFWFADKVTTMEGFQGKKIRVASPEAAELVSALGGSPVQIFPAEVYTALQRGTIDGVITGSGNIASFKWNDVLTSVYAPNIVLVSSSIVVSKAAYAKLPAELQTVLTEEMANIQTSIQNLMPQKDKSQIEALEPGGMTVTRPDAETYAKFRKLAEENVWTAWKGRVGPQAESILEEIRSATP